MFKYKKPAYSELFIVLFLIFTLLRLISCVHLEPSYDRRLWRENSSNKGVRSESLLYQPKDAVSAEPFSYVQPSIKMENTTVLLVDKEHTNDSQSAAYQSKVVVSTEPSSYVYPRIVVDNITMLSVVKGHAMQADIFPNVTKGTLGPLPTEPTTYETTQELSTEAPVDPNRGTNTTTLILLIVVTLLACILIGWICCSYYTRDEEKRDGIDLYSTKKTSGSTVDSTKSEAPEPITARSELPIKSPMRRKIDETKRTDSIVQMSNSTSKSPSKSNPGKS